MNIYNKYNQDAEELISDVSNQIIDLESVDPIIANILKQELFRFISESTPRIIIRK